MTAFRRSMVLLATVLLGAAASPASAQQRSIGSFGDWTAIVEGTGAQRICFIGSVPKTAEGKYTSRGEINVLVTHRPSERIEGEVSVTAGYTYKDGKDVEAEIDGRTFKLFSRGGNAWAQDAAADRTLVSAMKAGYQLVIRGTSSRGTLTTDTYSLSGFTAAYAAMDKACAGG